MKIFDKKLSIITIIMIIFLFIFLYFLTNRESTEMIDTNDLYIISDDEKNEKTTQNIIIHIAGEVNIPGLVYLKEGSRISDAIVAAGGTTDFADITKINLAYELKDAQKIYIPSIYDCEEIIYIQNDAGDNIIENNTFSNSLININTAGLEELESLPGIGSSTALKIIDYRTKNGSFKSIEEIKNISGIGDSKFNNIKDFICI